MAPSVYVSHAASRGRGLFISEAVTAGTNIPLGATNVATLSPGCNAHCCLFCGCFIGELGVKRLPGISAAVKCQCGQQYCSEECRENHLQKGHKFLCPLASASGAQLQELLAVESDATLFLPLATQVAAAIVAEAASGSAERAERTLAGAQETFRGCTQGGLWLEVAGLPAVDGHFSEEEEPSMSSSTTDTGEAPVEADEDDANEDESSGDEDEETSAA